MAAMTAAKIDALAEQLGRLLRAQNHDGALRIYDELRVLDPEEPRWPHRHGDLLLRLGRKADAIDAFERAVDLYAARGFLARAISMAKVIVGVDASRDDVLARLDPDAARELHRRRRQPGSGLKPLPEDAGEGRDLLSTTGSYPKLARATDAKSDELRFVEGRSIDLDLTELDVAERRISYPSLATPPEPTAEELALLPGLPLFAELPQAELSELVRRSELLQLDDGLSVVRAGEPADSMFAIIEGSAAIRVPGTRREAEVVLSEGDVFGEACLLEGAVRHADVFSKGRLVALRIPKTVLGEILARHAPIGRVLFELFTRRVVGNLLVTSPLFAGLDIATRKEIAKLFEVCRSDEKQTLVQRGKRSDGLFILVSGTLRLEGADRKEDLVPVTVFGQEALIEHAASAYSVVSVTDCLLLRLPALRFTRFAVMFPTVIATLTDRSSRIPGGAIRLG
jgi:CRP-like cAMP-binding protein